MFQSIFQNNNNKMIEYSHSSYSQASSTMFSMYNDEKRFYFLPSEIKKIKDLLKLNHEVGGVLKPYETSKGYFLRVFPKTKGGASNTKIPLDTLMFHTHPAACHKKSDCGLGMPSDNDVYKILDDSINGPCYKQCIFSQDGVYVVNVKQSVRDKYNNNNNRYRQNNKIDFKSYAQKFTDLQQKFNESDMGYDTFRNMWISFANNNSDSPIECRFFPNYSDAFMMLNTDKL